MPKAKVSVYHRLVRTCPLLCSRRPSLLLLTWAGPEEGEKYYSCISSNEGATPIREDPHDLAD